jgi:hypothetical protein
LCPLRCNPELVALTLVLCNRGVIGNNNAAAERSTTLALKIGLQALQGQRLENRENLVNSDHMRRQGTCGFSVRRFHKKVLLHQIILA